MLPVLLIAALALGACGEEPKTDSGDQAAKSASQSAAEPAPKPAPKPAAPVEPPQPETLPADAHPAMLDPSQASETAPDTFKVKLDTTEGPVVVEFVRDWAPHGVDRIWNMVKIGYMTDLAAFRVVPGFVAQFGIHGVPAVNEKWRNARLPPDPVKQSNTRGMVTFAMAGRPDTRSVQIFINYKDNTRLDSMGFAPIGKVIEGMEVVDKWHGGYGDRSGPNQGLVQSQGNAYLKAKFPELDYIKSAAIIE